MPLDYSGQNLQGRSFKGQNLVGANFSGTDIRGADFTKANLTNANFTGAKAGLQNYWIIGWLIILFIAGFLALFICAATNGLTWWYLGNEEFKRNALIFGLIIIFVLLILILINIYRGLTVSLLAISLILIFLLLPSGISVILNLSQYVAFRRWTQALSLASIIAIVMSEIIAIILVSAKILSKNTTVIVVLGLLFGGIIGSITRVLIRGGWKYLSSEPIWSANWAWVDLIWAWFWIGILIFLGSYIGAHALNENEKRRNLIISIAIAFSAIGGTSFRNANLTDANFTGATLKNTDFRKANLTRTRFYEAKNLEFSRVDDGILADRNVLNLLVTGNGRKKSYVGANLKGANLIGADLKEANLKLADISEATCQQACLEWVNLTRTQAVNTDFTSAQMTGACVEAWNIESTTKLDNVDCRFIYLLEYPKPGTDDRERRPSSGEFKSGEFTKLFEEVLNTVDLIFRNGIDWRAFANAFQTVQEQNQNTELALQSIENKGDGVVVVKVAVNADADKEKIHGDFTQNYQLALQAVEEKYKAVLQVKDEEILFHRQQSAKIPEMIISLANKPINVQVDNKVENKNMTNSNDVNRNINVGGNFYNSGTVNLGEISGNVTNTINQLPASPESEKPGIKELLKQLQTAIEGDTNLSQDDKAEALEQVKALAEAGKNPQEGSMQKAAKTAIKILKGTIAGLPSAANLVEEFGNILPLISSFLGLG
ncbi:pentapeptide repeat-containing protein [Fortiea contorta]|uniref:pentapeptide repeat-containing protein n=1 Tax=Fortiea contorta TaxID=1892405 RepID=UPI0003468AFA|nr:pentapeptide repeat-containing protein [Fortiea contorta]